MKLISLLIVIILASFSNSLLAQQVSKYEKVKDLFFVQLKTYSQEMDSYVEKSLISINSQKLDERNNCYQLGNKGITQILVIDADGIVADAAYSEDSKMAQCFEESFLGQRLPKPPISPYYMLMEMG